MLYYLYQYLVMKYTHGSSIFSKTRILAFSQIRVIISIEHEDLLGILYFHHVCMIYYSSFLQIPFTA